MSNNLKASSSDQSSSCCGGSGLSQQQKIELLPDSASWITGEILTAAGIIPKISTRLRFRDILGSWKARWGINRMNYKIKPGLYGVGNPGSQSPVLVSANYKLTFDRLRSKLQGLDAWLLILDTGGINVWCSAGKGTFSAEEIAKRLAETSLSQVVSHRKLILPQLSAPGVAAHEVTRLSSFKVIYGPVRAANIPTFIRLGLKVTSEMRQVRFTFFDRIILAPMELAGAALPVGIILGAMVILNLFGLWPFSLKNYLSWLGAILVGGVLVPALLPWIPGKAFAFKGWLLGLAWALAVNLSSGWLLSASPSWKQSLANFLLLPAISAFMGMNFTGSSTYTSLSGVLKETRIAMPLIITSGSLGLALIVVKMLIRF